MPLPPAERVNGIAATPPSINTSKLVPGGRYLVGTGPLSRSMCCWDLWGNEQSMNGPTVPALLSSIEDPDWGHIGRVLTQCYTEHPNHLVVAAWITTALGA